LLYSRVTQKYKQIKALFFLGIFGLLLLHQLLPHLHHQHHSHEVIAHGANHSHHHDDSHEESPRKGLLDLFLEFHIHSVVTNEVLVTNQSAIEKLTVKKLVNTTISHNHPSFFISFDVAEKVAVYHPPNIYFNPYRSSLDSRGPPFLG
jgi:zinc transporter ZupT